MASSSRKGYTMLKVTAFSIFMLLFSATQAVAGGVSDLRWMEGSWRSVDARIPMESEYTYQEKINSIIGVSRVRQGNQDVFLEFELLTENNGTLFLTVTQPGHPPVSFVQTSSSAKSVEFENPENEFPRVIRYALEEQGLLTSEIVGTVEGLHKSQKFVLKKK